MVGDAELRRLADLARPASFDGALAVGQIGDQTGQRAGGLVGDERICDIRVVSRDGDPMQRHRPWDIDAD